MKNITIPLKMITRFYYLFFLLSLFILEGCIHQASTENRILISEKAPQKIDTFVLEEQQMQSTIKIPGELIAFDQVDLYAKVSSFVKELFVDVGTRVTVNQLLATLEAPELNAQYEIQASNIRALEAEYISSRSTYDRLVETSKTPGTVPQNDLDIALAKRDADFARLESAKAARKEIENIRTYLEIRAPFSGIITSRNVSLGAYVGPTGKGSELPLFTLKQDKKLRLVIGVPQNYISYLKKDQKIIFTVPAISGKSFQTSISRTSGTLDNNIRSQRTEMDVDNSQGLLLPGMIAEVQLTIDNTHKAFVIPKSALLNSTKGVYVIKIENNKNVWIPVEVLRSSDENIEVSGALSYGDILVKSASEEHRDGVIVNM